MKDLQYKIEFTSFWHTGSGLSSGTESDLVVIKDKNGLPYIPGKTLKGLLREAAESINGFDKKLVTSKFINVVFGVKSEEGDNNSQKEAKSFFTDAYLSEDIRLYLTDNHEQKLMLYKNIASTKINDDGQAVDHSLRHLQVTIPLELYAEIIDFPEEYKVELENCFAWVKKMGLNRSRGLGRCKLETLNIR